MVNKINSSIFFGFVNRWYIEIDSLFGEIFFLVSIIFHFGNFKTWFFDKYIEGDTSPKNIENHKNLELTNAILLSCQICYLWWRVIDSLKSTKVYGGFLRSVFVVVRRLFLLVIFLYCFVLVLTGCFNLLFQQYTQFQSYFSSFFYLSQAALQQYNLESDWTTFINFSIMFFVGICTLILINLIIAYATKIYDEVDDDVEPEHMGNMIKLYEYLKWDEDYGIFKFLHAPLNIIQIPISVLILFSDNKKYWTDIFTKFLYFFIAILFFVLLIIWNAVRIPYVYIYYLL
jgi:hypothetical protein